jgi:DNA invertase Pin-like site-specific DNA recombinase
MNIGYARISTDDQTLNLQLDALKDAGCEKVFSDVVSGNTRERAGLSDALELLKAGDTLTVWKLDRLGRSIKNLIDLSEALSRRDVHLISLTDGINTQTHTGRFFFHVMAALAEMERELIRERTCAGIEAARKAGRIGGRKPAMTPEKKKAAQQLFSNGGMVAREIADSLGVSLPTLYRYFPASERT